VWSRLFGDSFDAYIALNMVVSGLGLIILFCALRRLSGVPLALAVTAVVSINPIMIEYAGAVRSEPLFVLLAIGTLTALLRADSSRARAPPAGSGLAVPGTDSVPTRLPNGGRAVWIGLAIVAMLMATMTRTIGVTLIAAIGFHWMLQRRWRTVGVLALVVLLAIVTWLIWTATGTEQYIGSSYIAELRSLWAGTPVTGPLPGRALRWAEAYVSHGIPWSLALPTIPGTAVDNAIELTWLGAFGVGGLIVLFRRWRPAALWIVGYGTFLAIWIFYVDRFVLPMVPLLTTCILLGAFAIGRRFGQRTAIALTASATAVLVLGAAMQLPGLVRERTHCDRSGPYPDPLCITADQRAYFDALRWIAANTPPTAVFMTAKSGALYLYADRRSIAFDPPLFESPDRVIESIRQRGADWVLLSNLWVRERDTLAPLLRAACAQLRLSAIFAPTALILRLDDPPADPASESAA
jgi:hypothetical protein